MLTGKGSMPVQREQVGMAPRPRRQMMEPDADDRGGKPDSDADDKGLMKLRYRKGGRRSMGKK